MTSTLTERPRQSIGTDGFAAVCGRTAEHLKYREYHSAPILHVLNVCCARTALLGVLELDRLTVTPGALQPTMCSSHTELGLPVRQSRLTRAHVWGHGLRVSKGLSQIVQSQSLAVTAVGIGGVHLPTGASTTEAALLLALCVSDPQ
eukprot:scaffold3068_cov401-Prasinococcus_capsulatus_cf.AAC.12